MARRARRRSPAPADPAGYDKEEDHGEAKDARRAQTVLGRPPARAAARPRRRRRNVARYRTRYRTRVHNVYRTRSRGRRHNLRFRRRTGPGFQLARPGTWAPGVLAAGAGAITATVLPRIVVGAGVTTPVVYAMQAGVGVVGASILGWSGMVRPSTAMFFFVGSTVPIVSDLFARFVLPWLGMAAYSYETAAELAELGQEPHFPPTLSAYAYETVSQLADGTGDDDTLSVSPQYGVDDMGGMGAGYGSAAPEAPWARASMVGH